ncbi:serine protease [Nesidiocoris tenuis]|uniref:Serine protease n=1 Tax=Nesidiocoris tenuis TaxID=355587 RepID=A0ABN7AXB5_9HEMI|nr:serine protease [Nesidiocoris tenuis]
MSTIRLWIGLILAVSINGDISSPPNTERPLGTTTVENDPTTEATTELDPNIYINKPSKFDDDISDKIYVDSKDIKELLEEENRSRNISSRDDADELTTEYPSEGPTGIPTTQTPAPERSALIRGSSNPIGSQEVEKNEISTRRRKRQAVWQVRRYVRFPGQPWDLAPIAPIAPLTPVAPRSPRLVFRDSVTPDLQTPAQLPVWTQNSLVPPEEPQQGLSDDVCAVGSSCQSLVGCWLSWGKVNNACNGFLQYCCDHSGSTANGAARSSQVPATPLPVYGPVVNDPRCGVSVKSQIAQRRIVGGDEAGFGSFPWQAYIRIGSSRCGGSLVNRYHVVTAGHCVARANARQVQVTLGDYVINSAVEPLPAYTYGVRQISVHPYFKFTPQADRFDVAVLRLDRPVQYMPHIAPICLPNKNEDFLGQYGWAAGWGALQPGSRLRPKTLQAVDVPVIDNRLCERWHRSNGINVVIYDEMLCAGYRGGRKDSCQGDSGGPLMLERNSRWFLIGIVSAGYSCAQKGQPGIYHRVAHTVDWISHIINS